ncbi:tyrosine-protein phosphatase [Bifidobacterium simiiventris]|uniref:tyrosine-protein phosphatase n=1 Tax=Bifidobacterium simiiventris TaxID=2834434 RepID=UPI001C55BA2D|nr:tyrosine-protein phosphatase [Bifidobacterium simiiventris]MBW3077782.1 tyrosine-protein phosphatase [Bifidobacterium simiiventris]
MRSATPLRRIPLENSCNVRDLGGYPTSDGLATRWGRFLRGGDQSTLSPADVATLRDYGIRSVIDLRSEEETVRHPDVMKDDPDIDYHHISFMVGDIDDATVKLRDRGNAYTIGDFYVQLLDQRKDVVRNLIEYIGDKAPAGAILFHCAAGKDRTGVLSMLLLMIAGVQVADIEANYQTTQSYILNDQRFLDSIASDYPIDMDDIPPEMLSNANTIRQAYEYVDGYGSVEAYLHACGVGDDTVNRVRARLVDE